MFRSRVRRAGIALANSLSAAVARRPQAREVGAPSSSHATSRDPLANSAPSQADGDEGFVLARLVARRAASVTEMFAARNAKASKTRRLAAAAVERTIESGRSASATATVRRSEPPSTTSINLVRRRGNLVSTCWSRASFIRRDHDAHRRGADLGPRRLRSPGDPTGLFQICGYRCLALSQDPPISVQCPQPLNAA